MAQGRYCGLAHFVFNMSGSSVKSIAKIWPDRIPEKGKVAELCKKLQEVDASTFSKDPRSSSMALLAIFRHALSPNARDMVLNKVAASHRARIFLKIRIAFLTRTTHGELHTHPKSVSPHEFRNDSRPSRPCGVRAHCC